MDDTAMVAGFQAGEPIATRAVYDRYAGAVFTVAMSMLGNRQLAEDAVQLTFFKAWRAARSVDESRVLAPWLYTIARRVAIDLGRADRRTPRSATLDDDRAACPPSSFERVWESWEVQVAVDELPPVERDIVRAQHYLGFSHAQIADRLRVPIGTVKSRSYRAHRRLAVRLRHLAEVA